MHYDAFLWTEGKRVLAEFPDCPGCQTFAGILLRTIFATSASRHE